MTMTELERLVGTLTYKRNNQCFHFPCSDLECQTNNSLSLMPLIIGWICRVVFGGEGGEKGVVQQDRQNSCSVLEAH